MPAPNYTSVVYQQEVLRERPDVTTVHMSLLPATWYVDQLRERHPDITIPWPRYVPEAGASIADIVEAEIGDRPVYVLGSLPEQLDDSFDFERAGLLRRLRPEGEVADEFSRLRSHPGLVMGYRFPDRAYPARTWEHKIAGAYSSAATDLGTALQRPGTAQDDWRTIEELYRLALRLEPEEAIAVDNLALLLRDNGSDPLAVADLLQRYLDLEPDDPDAPNIRTVMEDLRSRAP